MKPGVVIVKDRTRQFAAALQLLAETRVLVGFPSASDEKQGRAVGPDERKPDPEEPEPLNNATIGYLMNTGIPERNVPAREFMAAGIKVAEPRMTRSMKQIVVTALTGDTARIDQGYHAIGLTAQSGIRNVITAGIPPPLADSTLLARLRRHKRRKGEKAELAARAAGAAPSLDNVKPLIDTKQLFNAISYVLRQVRGKKRA